MRLYAKLIATTILKTTKKYHLKMFRGKSTKIVKWCCIVFSVTLLLEEIVFRDFLVKLASTSHLVLPSQNVDDKNTVTGARKLLGNGDVWNAFSNSSSPSNQIKRLPTCIIIGARKCGTRALLQFLDLHPQIAIAREEVHFFSNDTNYRKGVEWYRSRMPRSTADQITIEKTPKYFISQVAPARMHRLNSEMKIIVILRHPTTRLISDFTQTYSHKTPLSGATKSFTLSAIDSRTGHVNLNYKAMQVSIYHQHLSRWLTLFPNSQIHVVDGDALVKNPIPELSKVETFLGLKHKISSDYLYYNHTRGFYCMRQMDEKPERCLGANKGRKHVDISDWVKKKLDTFFRPHNEVLYKLIGRRFRWR